MKSSGQTKPRNNKYKKLKLKRRYERKLLAKKVYSPTKNTFDPLSKTVIDYKNTGLLKNYISFEGKILSRRFNRLTAKKQRAMSRAIKTARVVALLPFIRH